MTIWIACFLFLGACFGLVTHSRRHLFSEGASKPTAAADAGPLDTLFAWTLICSCLWPLMALTGLFSLWTLRARARAVRRNTR